MDLQSTYHLQSLNQMLELSEINTRLRDLHSIRELDVDGDLLINAGHTIGRIFKGMPDRIMHLALLAHLFHFRLDLGIFCRIACHCYRIDLLMCLLVPCFESWVVRSTSGRFACKELRVLYSARLCRLLRKALSLVQKPKAFKIFTAIYHRSHSLNKRKGIKSLFHAQDVKIDSLQISSIIFVNNHITFPAYSIFFPNYNTY